MLNHAKEQIASRKLSREAFINEEGAIDLASIMVGIIVIGIIGGIIAATVFAVIPWSQDNAAKSALGAVDTAESAYSGFSVEKGQPPYTNLAKLESDKLIANAGGKLTVTAYNNGNCYVSLSKSATGKTFWKDSINNKVQELTGSSTSSCGPVNGSAVVTTEYGSIGQAIAHFSSGSGGTVQDGWQGFYDNSTSFAPHNPNEYGNLPSLAAYQGQKSLPRTALPASNVYIVYKNGTRTNLSGNISFAFSTDTNGKINDLFVGSDGTVITNGGNNQYPEDGSYLYFTVNGAQHKLKFEFAAE